MGFSRQEYWSGLTFPSPGDLPYPGIEPGSPALQADSLPTELLGKTYLSSIPCSLWFYLPITSRKAAAVAAAAAKSFQSCLTLCYPIDSSPPGSPIPGILQARTLEWIAISFSRGSSLPRNRTWVSCIAGRWFTNWAMREAHIGKERRQTISFVNFLQYHLPLKELSLSLI